jgi:hypothetical protein
LITAGFVLDRIRYINLLGAMGWFMYCRVFRVKRPPLRAFGLFNRVLPGYAVLDRIIGPPLGQSLIAVGYKTGTAS